MMKNIKVAIIDDHILFADSLALMLDNQKGISVGIIACNGLDFFKKLEVAKKKPDVVIMDIEMPEMNGIQATAKLHKDYPDIKIIAVTMHSDDSYIISMLEEGVNGYLFKDTESSELVKAIIAVNEGETFFNKQTIKALSSMVSRNKKVKPNKHNDDISKRELEVLTLICEALTADEIGNRLHISRRTVESHSQNLLSKTNSRNAIALVAYAYSNNLVPIKSTPNIK